MKAKDTKVFIDSVINYFSHVDGKQVTVGTPFLRQNESLVHFDYVGLITITGKKQGQVYYTAPKAMLKHMLLSLGIQDTSAENMKDVIGEVANIISGNVRKEFGPRFMISVPKVIDPSNEEIYLEQYDGCYVVPIYWKNYHSAVVINLN